MGAYIKKIEFYLPEKILTNKEISQLFPDWTSDKIEDKIGVRERRIVGENETALDLAFEACNKILLNEDKSSIDFIILCTQSPEYYLPTTACILQDKLGLRTDIGAFDFNLGCSGYIYGLSIAKGLLEANIAKKILLVTSETYSKHINPIDKGNRTIFGDGATATIIEYSTKNKIFDFELGTDGSGYNHLIVANGGMRNRNSLDEVGNDLYMDGPEIFNFTIQIVPSLIKKVLGKNSLLMDDINYFVFHQANKYMLDYLKKKMKIPDNKFYNNLLLTGNTVSSTIPLALSHLHKDMIIREGMKVLLVGFGVGLSWGATVIEI